MKRILITDDSPSSRQLVAAALSSGSEYQLERAASGIEAIKLLSTSPFDLVITDVNMPDINGIELIRFVKSNERLRQIPIITMSTDASLEDQQRVLSLGATTYLVKPFTSEQLRSAIEDALKDTGQ
jgi:two-component system, chemotaxis family, chemotaxis protein CheY